MRDSRPWFRPRSQHRLCSRFSDRSVVQGSRGLSRVHILANGRNRCPLGRPRFSATGGRQWVLSVRKRLRCHLQRDSTIAMLALRIFLSVVEQALLRSCPATRPNSRIRAVAFIRRFGALCNPQVHFPCIVIEGVFAADTARAAAFHESPTAELKLLDEVQAKGRRRVRGELIGRAVLDPEDAESMASREYGGGFSLNAKLRVEGADRPGLERLLRDCARPAFAVARLREIDAEHLVYQRVKPGSGGNLSVMLTPLELIERLAALIPTPRRHRHRYYGVLATCAPAAVCAYCPFPSRESLSMTGSCRHDDRHRKRRPAIALETEP